MGRLPYLASQVHLNAGDRYELVNASDGCAALGAAAGTSVQPYLTGGPDWLTVVLPVDRRPAGAYAVCYNPGGRGWGVVERNFTVGGADAWAPLGSAELVHNEWFGAAVSGHNLSVRGRGSSCSAF